MIWRWKYKTNTPSETLINYFDNLISDSTGEINIGNFVLYKAGCHFIKREDNKIFGIFSGDESKPRSGFRYCFTLRIITENYKTVIKCTTRPSVYGIIASAVLPLGALASVRYYSDAFIPIIFFGLLTAIFNTIAAAKIKKELDFLFD